MSISPLNSLLLLLLCPSLLFCIGVPAALSRGNEKTQRLRQKQINCQTPTLPVIYNIVRVNLCSPSLADSCRY